MITAARPLRDGRLGARVAFGATAARAVAEPHRTQLLRKRNGRTWKLVGWAEREGPVETTLVPGKRYEFKVRTLDEAGNVLTSERLRAVLTVRDWASRQLRRTPGDWTTTTGDPRRGEPVDGALASRTADAAITTSFQGDGVALVAPVGPAGGAMRVRLDGGDWVRGELSHAEPAERAIVFSRYLRGGAHSLDIGVADGVIALDSMMILRIPRA